MILLNKSWNLKLKDLLQLTEVDLKKWKQETGMSIFLNF